MGVIINLDRNIKKFINIKNFRVRFTSTVLLLFIFFTIFYLGNPVLPMFLIVIFLAVLYEFNLICNDKIKLTHLITIFIFPILLFVFLILEINNFTTLINNYSNYFLSLLIALIINSFHSPISYFNPNLGPHARHTLAHNVKFQSSTILKICPFLCNLEGCAKRNLADCFSSIWVDILT